MIAAIVGTVSVTGILAYILLKRHLKNVNTSFYVKFHYINQYQSLTKITSETPLKVISYIYDESNVKEQFVKNKSPTSIYIGEVYDLPCKNKFVIGNKLKDVFTKQKYGKLLAPRFGMMIYKDYIFFGKFTKNGEIPRFNLEGIYFSLITNRAYFTKNSIYFPIKSVTDTKTHLDISIKTKENNFTTIFNFKDPLLKELLHHNELTFSVILEGKKLDNNGC